MTNNCHKWNRFLKFMKIDWLNDKNLSYKLNNQTILMIVEFLKRYRNKQKQNFNFDQNGLMFEYVI